MTRRQELRPTLLVLLFLAGSCSVHDLTVPAGRGLAARSAIAAIESYRSHVSPWIGRVVTCRFTPSCSLYGLESIRRYGALRGGLRTVGRIARCNPMTPPGTRDEP
jgi:putative membrane protein insertion efficiency factor